MALLIMFFGVASALRTSIDVRPKQNEYLQEHQRNRRETPMFHKFAISFVTALIFGAASVATPAAAAHGGLHEGGGGGGSTFHSAGFSGRNFGGCQRRGLRNYGRGFGYFGGYSYEYPYSYYYPYYPYYPYNPCYDYHYYPYN